MTARWFALNLVSLVLVLAIGWIDLVTGRDIGLSLLYLIPVALSGWFAGLSSAIVIGSAAAVMWFVAAGPDSESQFILIWNTLTRLVIYVSQGVMLAMLRRDREVLRRYGRRESTLARTDVLTGLLNARGFLEVAEAELERARAVAGSICIAYIDLDNFKPFNDRFGHAAGDDILVEVARILRGSIGEKSAAARLGGDEFVLLLRGSDQDQAEAIGGRIAQEVRSAGSIWNLGFGATIGIARFRSLPENVTELLHLADDVMYAGKASAKGSVTVREL